MCQIEETQHMSTQQHILLLTIDACVMNEHLNHKKILQTKIYLIVYLKVVLKYLLLHLLKTAKGYVIFEQSLKKHFPVKRKSSQTINRSLSVSQNPHSFIIFCTVLFRYCQLCMFLKRDFMRANFFMLSSFTFVVFIDTNILNSHIKLVKLTLQLFTVSYTHLDVYKRQLHDRQR